METFVARSIAGRLTQAQVGRVEANLEAQRANLVVADAGQGIALDGEFHTLFCEFLGNREILRVMGQLRDKTHRVISQVFKLNPPRMAQSYEEHRGIADAIIGGDAPLASRRIEEHLRYGKEALLSPRRP